MLRHNGTYLVPLVAFVATLAAGALWAGSGVGGFVESPLEKGVWLHQQKTTSFESLGSNSILSTQGQNIWHVPGLTAPGALFLSGTDLFCTNHLGSQSVSVLDVGVMGSEAVTSSIPTPVDPVDLAVVSGNLNVIGPLQGAVHQRPLAGGSWTFFNIPSAFPHWSYGNVLHLHPDGIRLFVVQLFENRILVIDLPSQTVTHTITDLHHLPDQVAFFSGGNRMAVLSIGLDHPDCAAPGPHISVYDVSTTPQRLFEIDVSGECPLGLAEGGDTLFAVREFSILSFDGMTGIQKNMIPSPDPFSGDVVIAQGEVIGQQNGSIRRLESDLSSISEPIPLLTKEMKWNPPLSEMVHAGDADGRLFVANRNDGSITIVDLDPACYEYGNGCPGQGDFIPWLTNTGCPSPGLTFSLDLRAGLGGAPAFFFVGSSQGLLPLGGECALLVAPLSSPVGPIPLGGSGPGAGNLSLQIPVPAQTPIAAVATIQAFVQDPGGVTGFSSSNALFLTVE